MFSGKEGDNSLKSVILVNGLDSVWAEAHKEHYKGNEQPLLDFKAKYGDDIYRVAKNLNEARYHRYKKCKSKVGSIIEGDCAYFITLTFNDKTLNSTSQSTRRRYVSRLLKQVSKCYVANIDFGDKIKNPDSNQREHYHAIVYSQEEPSLTYWRLNYGFVKVVKCGYDDKDKVKVCKYVTKLSHHALKGSTVPKKALISPVGEVTPLTAKLPRLIYSRGAFQVIAKKYQVPPDWLFD
jgi:hypothetical protein